MNFKAIIALEKLHALATFQTRRAADFGGPSSLTGLRFAYGWVES